jgi:hypothetical protein
VFYLIVVIDSLVFMLEILCFYLVRMRLLSSCDITSMPLFVSKIIALSLILLEGVIMVCKVIVIFVKVEVIVNVYVIDLL